MKSGKPIESCILTVRGQKVVLDADLAELYCIQTRVLNQAIKRNADRFPEDFVFQLTAEEKSKVITVCDHLSKLKFSKTSPFAFTEHGAIMAATILNSPEAVAMSVYVVRAFVQMRQQIAANAEILKRLAEIDKTLLKHDESLRLIWSHLKPLLIPPDPTPKRRIGFNRDKKA
ncbi:MAG: ORF6N domain-containing protein [Candidatus Hydrogenedentes bacterium]|nr:ORF6N domain-containing protein [Candidatus Hydrogenedentota bacterium]